MARYRIIEISVASGEKIYFVEEKGLFFWKAVQVHGRGVSEDYMTTSFEEALAKLEQIKKQKMGNEISGTTVVYEE